MRSNAVSDGSSSLLRIDSIAPNLPAPGQAVFETPFRHRSPSARLLIGGNVDRAIGDEFEPRHTLFDLEGDVSDENGLSGSALSITAFGPAFQIIDVHGFAPVSSHEYWLRCSLDFQMLHF